MDVTAPTETTIVTVTTTTTTRTSEVPMNTGRIVIFPIRLIVKMAAIINTRVTLTLPHRAGGREVIIVIGNPSLLSDCSINNKTKVRNHHLATIGHTNRNHPLLLPDIPEEEVAETTTTTTLSNQLLP